MTIEVLNQDNYPGYVKPDNRARIHFYEQEFYVFSNFSAFRVFIFNHDFMTAEHAYQYAKFYTSEHKGPERRVPMIQIKDAGSAHRAFKIARESDAYKSQYWDRNPNGTPLKLIMMEQILRKKVEQHDYVRKKLIQSGSRHLIEDSWRDDYWGWGPNADGQNMLGQLWMKIRRDYISKENDDGDNSP